MASCVVRKGRRWLLACSVLFCLTNVPKKSSNIFCISRQRKRTVTGIPCLAPLYPMPLLLVARLQRALSVISCGVLKAVARQSLPEVDGDHFMSLVDDGEGGVGTGKWGLSCTPLRMCRYAGDDGVAFGETCVGVVPALVRISALR